MSTSKEMTFRESESLSRKEADGAKNSVDLLSDLARHHGIWISGGSIHERAPNGKVWNSGFVVDDRGALMSPVYRKAHLFSIDSEKVKLTEHDTTLPGEDLVVVPNTPVGNLGMGICYDLRFPYFSEALRHRHETVKADCLIFPSAFTVPTGLKVWSPLLRARAIENQCFVVAAAQAGIHSTKRTSYGHSLVVGPDGTVVAEGGGYGLRGDEEEDGGDLIESVKNCNIYANLDLSEVEQCRRSLQVERHRRPNDLNEVTVAKGPTEHVKE